MIKVLGRNNSSNVQKVLWALEEMEVAYEREDYGGPFGKVDDDAYKEMNPNSVVPTIIDDGFVLWESNACVRYLAAKFGEGTLWPTDPHVRADADRWMDWQQTTVSGPITPVFWGLIRLPAEQRDAQLIARSRDELEAVLGILDQHLQQRAFVAGSVFTMGDIPLGIMAYRWFNLEIPRASLPALEEWYQRLLKRKAFASTVAIGLT